MIEKFDDGAMTITVYFDAEEAARLKELASEDDCTYSSMIKSLVRNRHQTFVWVKGQPVTNFSPEEMVVIEEMRLQVHCSEPELLKKAVANMARDVLNAAAG